MEKKQIFRQKSLERMNTPESLNNYIRVTTPAVWVVLIAVILLIVGAFVWAASVKLATKTITGAAVVKNRASPVERRFFAGTATRVSPAKAY